ncbi:hypothetical protein SynBIOSE41_00144 [Synechococcus sp. BIOS-E4-1]|nr:hypothetical protein SynBIOSE41_00144 [Synechococcus sp. BIOS-E4-1]
MAFDLLPSMKFGKTCHLLRALFRTWSYVLAFSGSFYSTSTLGLLPLKFITNPF